MRTALNGDIALPQPVTERLAVATRCESAPCHATELGARYVAGIQSTRDGGTAGGEEDKGDVN